MRILVPVKQVPESSEVKIDEISGTMIRRGAASIINPLDLYAIEVAIQLKEQVGGDICVISMGPKNAIEAIKEAIAMGCDDGVLLSDRKLAGSDTWATSYVISQAIQKLGSFDLIICGERATDGDTGQVGPGIASFLGAPVITYVAELRVDGNSVEARRLVEDGYEVYRCAMPLVITVVKEIAYPRLPTLRGKQKARKMTIPVWDKEFLGLDEQRIGLRGSPTRVTRITRPKVSRGGERFIVKTEEDLGDAAGKIVEYLADNNLL